MVADNQLEESILENLQEAFEQEYRRLYGRLCDGVEVEAVHWRVTVSGPPSSSGPYRPTLDGRPHRQRATACATPMGLRRQAARWAGGTFDWSGAMQYPMALHHCQMGLHSGLMPARAARELRQTTRRACSEARSNKGATMLWTTVPSGNGRHRLDAALASSRMAAQQARQQRYPPSPRRGNSTLGNSTGGGMCSSQLSGTKKMATAR